jgi:hypothetical protein
VTFSSSCKICHAPKNHERVACPLCGALRAHCAGIYSHLSAVHAVRPGGRPHALLVDVARFAVRGWPVEPALEACRRAGIPVDFGGQRT